MVDMPSNQTKLNPTYLIYMNKEDLTLNNLQWFICNKAKPNQTYIWSKISSEMVFYVWDQIVYNVEV